MPQRNNNNNNPRGGGKPRQIRSDKPVDEETANSAKQQPANKVKSGLAKSVGRPNDTRDAFKPLALNPIGSEERNDPLILESILVEGLSAGIPCERVRTFQDDFSQYQQVVLSAYRVMTSQDRTMKKYLSSAMFNYYCNVLLFKRLMYVLTEKGQGVNEYEAFLRKLPPMAIPHEIGIYLLGIGNLTDYNKRHYFLQVQASLRNDAILGIAGHYGRVDVQTHILYETLPSPFIAVFRMLQDYAYSLQLRAGLQPDRDWNLPAGLIPNIPGLVPNRNLLGWDRRQGLTTEQLASMDSAQVNAQLDENNVVDFNVDGIENFNGYPIIYPLLNSVNGILASAKSNQVRYNDYVFPTSYKGSLSQIAFQRRNTGHRGAGYPLVPIYEKESTAYSYSQASIHTLSGASLFRYRVDRHVRGFNDGLCYSGPQGGAPHGWLATGNQVFDSVPNWNIPDFRTTEIAGNYADDRFAEKVRKVPPSEAV